MSYHNDQNTSEWHDLHGCEEHDRAERAQEWNDQTPVERLQASVADLKARLELANERCFFLAAELASANARLGITNYRTCQ